MNTITALSRRDALRLSGGLVVLFSTGVAAADRKGAPDPTSLDSWLAIGADGNITAFFGKVDVGQGLDVAVAQMVAEELDVPVAAVSIVMGDTSLTCNQGGASGSTGVRQGGVALRHAAAQARHHLIQRAAEYLRRKPADLATADGAVFVVDAPAQKVAYAALLRGKYFQSQIRWNGKLGNALGLTSTAKPKAPDQYKIVGQPVSRVDIPGKVMGTKDFVTDVRVPGMLHGRVIRPPVAGAVPMEIDRKSVASIPGVQIVHRQGFLGVVAPREWDAIRAADVLQVTWSKVDPPFPAFAALHDHIRKAPAIKETVDKTVGDVERALAGAAKRITAEYTWPFQSHACMGPACAVADVRADGVTSWSATQKPHFQQEGLAKLLKRPLDTVRVIWMPGPGSYGRNDAGDAAMDAALLSEAVGKPVRVQGMRHDGHAWDPKGPASVHTLRAGLDKDGNIVAYDVMNKGFSRVEVAVSEADPSDTLAGKLIGFPDKPGAGFGSPSDVYEFANRRLAWQCVAPLMPGASPLRGAHLRDPVGPQNLFASESFLDEIALAAKVDPIALRLRYMKDPREVAAVKAATERAKWIDGPPGARRQMAGAHPSGMGFAFARRGDTLVAVIAQVEVDRDTGRIWARKFVVAHDCGQVINPDGLRHCIEGNVVQGLSRAVHEEVLFDQSMVTSRDWSTYLILDIADAPEEIDIVLIDRPELAPEGAGEACTAAIPAAVVNAIFDATGVRMRAAPLSPARVKAALTAKTV